MDEKGDSISGYQQVQLSEQERAQLVQHIQTAVSLPYKEGGNTTDKGFDSAGLIQWAYREMGFERFRKDDEVFRQTTPDDLYRYNASRLENQADLRRGDFLFFDMDSNGRMDHNAVFDRMDEQGRIWVYDAYPDWGVVTYRFIESAEKQRMFFGRPLKTIPK
jgi:cell wall-associated NlpC family hydrolase